METITASPDMDLQTLFDNAPKGSAIRLKAGVYRQKIFLRTPGLTLFGEGAKKTILCYGDYAKKLDAQGAEYNTFRTFSVAVLAEHITFRELSVINDALHPETKGQEVALSVLGDSFRMEHCRLSSTQDTLFLGPLPEDLIRRYEGFLPDELRKRGVLRQHIRNCVIEGNVDFIFGCGEALFEDCELRSVADVRGVSYVAAPAHSPEQKEGFTFRKCRFTHGENVPPQSVFLARPWRDYGLARFEECAYDRHIHPLGFDQWNDTDRDKTARFHETPPVAGRVPWVNRTP